MGIHYDYKAPEVIKKCGSNRNVRNVGAERRNRLPRAMKKPYPKMLFSHLT